MRWTEGAQDAQGVTPMPQRRGGQAIWLPRKLRVIRGVSQSNRFKRGGFGKSAFLLCPLWLRSENGS